MNLAELKEKALALSEEIADLSTIEDPTDEQLIRMSETVDEAAVLAADIDEATAEARAKNLDTIARFASKPGHVEVEAEPAEPIVEGARIVKRFKRDPYDLSDIRMGAMVNGNLNSGSVSELRARAHDAVEQAPEYMSDTARETVARHLDNDEDGSFAAHCLSHGSADYRDQFFRYLKTGENMRAALTTTGANGGYLIPFMLDPTIIMTNTGSKNPFRQISRVETITSNVWHGVSSSGVTAEWTAEAAEMADASPTFVQPTVTPVRADAYVQASFEVTQDSNIASQIGMLFADAKDRLEAAAFATGTGSTQPMGIVTKLQATTASRVAAQTNASFGPIDVYSLVNNLPARYQDDCSWLSHWSIYNLVRQFATSGSGISSAFWVDLGPGIPSQLLGQNTYVSSAMQAAPLSTATASNDDVLILGDFSQGFLIVDRIGMEIVYNPLVLGSSRRPTGEVGWAGFWRVGSDVPNPDAFRLLRI